MYPYSYSPLSSRNRDILDMHSGEIIRENAREEEILGYLKGWTLSYPGEVYRRATEEEIAAFCAADPSCAATVRRSWPVVRE